MTAPSGAEPASAGENVTVTTTIRNQEKLSMWIFGAGVNSSMKGATMRGTAVAVIGTIILAGSSARAHHGYANFLINQNVSIEGDIEEFRYANPHIVLKIRTADSILYTATWEAPKRVERAGVKRTTLKVGDHVIVTGAPPRDPASHELMPVRAIHRPRDGWKWPG